MLRPYLIIAAIGAVGAAFWLGWAKGEAAAEARHTKAVLAAQMAQVAAANEIAKKERERLDLEAERDEIARQLEDAAYAQPADGSCGLGADRVRRLNLR